MKDSEPQWWRAWLTLACAAAGAVAVFVFWPAVDNGFVNWDDPLYLQNVARLQRFSLAALEWIAKAWLPL